VSITGFIKGFWRKMAADRQKKKMLQCFAPNDVHLSDWADSLLSPTDFYVTCFRFFHQRLPVELQEHRRYFTSERRGFGEDAFHAMWFLLFREFHPKNFLEIGVFRGQTLSLAALLSHLNGAPCEVCGISPFSSAGDAVSRYRENVDYYENTVQNFGHFKLPAPQLIRAFSTDPEAARFIVSKEWDVIYIDGNHDYEIARKDWEICSRYVRPGGIIVLDDSGLTTSFRPPAFATGGHPGPSRLAREIDRKRFREILQVGHNRVFQKIA
jgi:SAM-dependent methyltransferase